MLCTMVLFMLLSIIASLLVVGGFLTVALFGDVIIVVGAIVTIKLLVKYFKKRKQNKGES